MDRIRSIPRSELALLVGAMAVGFAIRLAYVIATRGHQLAGDELEYNIIGQLFVDGHFMWSTTPWGDPHPTMTKTPLYPMIVGASYSLLGESYDRLLALQTLLGPVSIALTWLLARRLFNPKVAIAAAIVMAIYPFAWQYEARLYSEAIATPLLLLALLLFLDREPTRGRAALLGVVMGLLILTRPALGYVFIGAAIAWIALAGWRRGLVATGVAVVVAAVVVTPWLVRNYQEYDSIVLTWTDAAVMYGTFNDEAANDPKFPYAWRVSSSRDAPLFEKRNETQEDELRSKLLDNSIEWIKDHPRSIPDAFFWNGLVRFWDIQRPSYVTRQAPLEGRSKTLIAIGLAMYWVMLPLALAALVIFRRRRALVLPVAAMVLVASVIHTTAAFTRYRSILEPVIVVLACAAVSHLLAARRARNEQSVPATA